MKFPFAAIILLILPSFLLANSPGKDFLITLNGSKLTGNIKDISFSNGQSQIYFENDFGDTYTVFSATIYGFAFYEGGETSIFESKFLNGKWRFLKVEKKGEALSMFTSSERQLKFTNFDESPKVVKEKNPQFWLQFKGEKPFKLYKLTYKRVLREKMSSFSDLTERLGKRGFRYHNLPMIVDLYNRLHREKGAG